MTTNTRVLCIFLVRRVALRVAFYGPRYCPFVFKYNFSFPLLLFFRIECRWMMLLGWRENSRCTRIENKHDEGKFKGKRKRKWYNNIVYFG